MAPGRKTGGRQPGSRNKKTLAQKEAALAALAKLTDKIPDAFQGESVAYLISLYRDPQQPLPVRLDAAKAAAAAIGQGQRQSLTAGTPLPGEECQPVVEGNPLLTAKRLLRARLSRRPRSDFGRTIVHPKVGVA